MNAFETFLKLHQADEPLLLGNAWDVTSAKLLERNGLKAIATSSAAVARSMGYEDGENIPFELLLQIAKRIKSQISIPFSVDMERGYSSDIAGIVQNIEKLHDIGVVGINIEDSGINEKRKLQSEADFQKTLSSIANQLSQKNIKLFINARTDGFLLNLPSPLQETLKRIKAYEKTGIDGIFVPFIREKSAIKEVVEATELPINVLGVPGLPSFKELSDLGVKRISMGSSLHNSMTKTLELTIQTILKDQSFKSLQ
jgi:2-methylisocitrate lyase-like PEP mutase family enzyme